MTEALKSVAPIARASVEDRVAEALRELIVAGQLPEGTPLVQRDLAERLGVSQTPVRLALTELQRSGLVEVAGNGRAHVRRLTREDFEETYAVRRGLEALAARAGAAAVGPAELERMEALLAKLERLAARGDVDGYLRARWEFHATCYAAAGRPRLLAEVERLFWRSERYNRLVLSRRERFDRSVRNYRRLYEACRAGDPAAAERAIEEQMRWAVELVLDSLPSEVEE
ncbi:MAG TPA: GntR family transcriptional regulator [Gaiellaceae bacterium]|nr:GntR family transcriptional regulator [Gaiellaceae bacterium]